LFYDIFNVDEDEEFLESEKERCRRNLEESVFGSACQERPDSHCWVWLIGLTAASWVLGLGVIHSRVSALTRDSIHTWMRGTRLTPLIDVAIIFCHAHRHNDQ
jgi:hypothetical protein